MASLAPRVCVLYVVNGSLVTYWTGRGWSVERPDAKEYATWKKADTAANTMKDSRGVMIAEEIVS